MLLSLVIVDVDVAVAVAVDVVFAVVALGLLMLSRTVALRYDWSGGSGIYQVWRFVLRGCSSNAARWSLEVAGWAAGARKEQQVERETTSHGTY